jgi:hypothetical protein
LRLAELMHGLGTVYLLGHRYVTREDWPLNLSGVRDTQVHGVSPKIVVSMEWIKKAYRNLVSASEMIDKGLLKLKDLKKVWGFLPAEYHNDLLLLFEHHNVST